jgi:hypothetical protein
MANSELKQQFDLLDQSLFKADSKNASEVDSTIIVKGLKGFKPSKKIGKSHGTELKPLYPNQDQ